MNISLAGRRALITGASEGLGLAMARRFAASGADVAMLARRPDVLEAAAASVRAAAPGRTIVALPCDVANADAIAATWPKAEAALGGIDILVNNAGTSKRGPFPAITDAEWQADLDLKLFAAIRLARLAWPGMAERRWGRILNVLNIGAKAPPAEGAPTAVSRAAGMALTKVLANEGAPRGILVNALLVGIIESAQWVRRHAAEKRTITWEQWCAEQGAAVPLGRLGTAEEFANVACFLASDAAGYVTGTAINVDGGRSPVV
ncbi:SDR family NAD(P)-dependent oxidoreductase [Elioraea tepidiphila]|jgi:NAD(P)-dependent dehydrogenase (short-subunit alcohol dehydrogenase family)|uniref:SDR family NAD(P)-dependent oxidoreductase n=1 Tax=Elioraea tepidiphila TaxID=457934 RepID=UPI0003625D72|nr:SDR family oxidoreductase [Elioraea tepidiphila]